MKYEVVRKGSRYEGQTHFQASAPVYWEAQPACMGGCVKATRSCVISCRLNMPGMIGCTSTQAAASEKKRRRVRKESGSCVKRRGERTKQALHLHVGRRQRCDCVQVGEHPPSAGGAAREEQPLLAPAGAQAVVLHQRGEGGGDDA